MQHAHTAGEWTFTRGTWVRNRTTKGDDAHGKFMDATHSYCDAQEGGGTDSDDDEHVSHYMKGGAYWDDDVEKKKALDDNNLEGGHFGLWDGLALGANVV